MANRASRLVAQARELAHVVRDDLPDGLRRLPGSAPLGDVVARPQDALDLVVVDLDAIENAAVAGVARLDRCLQGDHALAQMRVDLVGEEGVAEQLEAPADETVGASVERSTDLGEHRCVGESRRQREVRLDAIRLVFVARLRVGRPRGAGDGERERAQAIFDRPGDGDRIGHDGQSTDDGRGEACLPSPSPARRPCAKLRNRQQCPDRAVRNPIGGHHGDPNARRDRPRAHPRADRARGRAARRAHAAARSAMYERARGDARRRRRLLLPGARPLADLPRRTGKGRAGLGRRRQRACSTSTTASARWCRATRTRRSRRPSASASSSALTSRRRPRTRSSSSEELARRFGLPKWRYVNSGSEATMDAIRIARAVTGPRHDRQDLRLLPRPPRLRDGLDRRPVRQDRRPRRPRRRCPTAPGIPQAVVDLTIPVPFNDADAMERRIERLIERGPQARLRDHGGGDDEPRRRPARARLPRGRPRAHAQARHRCSSSTR